jgi:hypothetical protein
MVASRSLPTTRTRSTRFGIAVGERPPAAEMKRLRVRRPFVF